MAKCKCFASLIIDRRKGCRLYRSTKRVSFFSSRAL